MHLAWHLSGAGEHAGLRRLLFDFDYLEVTLRTMRVNALIADYDILGEAGEPRTLQEALRLSAHMLSRDWGGLLGPVLAGQLLGRLGHLGKKGRLLESATDGALLCPRHVWMNRPGGPLIRTLEGHTSWVTALVVLDDKRLVSASQDRTLRVWDLSSGQTLVWGPERPDRPPEGRVVRWSDRASCARDDVGGWIAAGCSPATLVKTEAIVGGLRSLTDSADPAADTLTEERAHLPPWGICSNRRRRSVRG